MSQLGWAGGARSLAAMPMPGLHTCSSFIGRHCCGAKGAEPPARAPPAPCGRRDHQSSYQRQQESRQLREDALDDFTTLTKHMHEMRAAKEDAERELGAVVAMFDQVRGDWQRKLKDRRKEVGGPGRAWAGGTAVAVTAGADRGV